MVNESTDTKLNVLGTGHISLPKISMDNTFLLAVHISLIEFLLPRSHLNAMYCIQQNLDRITILSVVFVAITHTNYKEAKSIVRLSETELKFGARETSRTQ